MEEWQGVELALPDATEPGSVSGTDSLLRLFSSSRVPPAAAIRLAVMHSLDALSAVVILDCMCMVCMVETSAGGRGRVRVMFVCQVRVVGTVGGSQKGLYRELVVAVAV